MDNFLVISCQECWLTSLLISFHRIVNFLVDRLLVDFLVGRRSVNFLVDSLLVLS